MRRTIVYSFNNADEGGFDLSRALGIRQMLHRGSQWVHDKDTVVINWGCGQPGRDSFQPCYKAGRIINHPEALMKTINKQKFFQWCRDHPKNAPRVSLFTSEEEVALSWLKKGEVVLARTSLEGARGEGIVVMKKPLDFVYAPLYTKYIDKDAEYRIHVVNGKMVFKQQKIWDEVTPGFNEKKYVRSRDNGFILVTKVKPVPQDVIDQSIKAVKFFGLDFGAVDIVCKDGLGYVLEINSAPWMDEESTEAYAKELKEMCV